MSRNEQSSACNTSQDGTVNLSGRLAGCRRSGLRIEVYCQPLLQISSQTWNVWFLEALCSAAVTRSRRSRKRLLI